MKKVKPLDKITIKDTDEFVDILKNKIFKPLTPEEQEEIDKKLPKSLRRGQHGRSKSDDDEQEEK